MVNKTSDLFVHIFVVDHFISGGWAAVLLHVCKLLASASVAVVMA